MSLSTRTRLERTSPWRRLYTLGLWFATPLILGRLLWRSRRAPAYRHRWRERFGYVPSPGAAPVIWLHAVSVGETVAAAPLVQALLDRHPDHQILVTSTTPTGAQQVRSLFGDRVRSCYLPYDTPGAVRRFLDRVSPMLGIVMETEIWPNLMAATEARGIPVVLANARLSERSARGYARLARLTAETLARFTLIAAQHEADAARFRRLGAPPQRVQVIGNLKFDQHIDEDQRHTGQALRARLGEQRPVWVAASTHEGEESVALAAHHRVREHLPDAVLILVPRHPERFPAVAAMVANSGLAMIRRTATVEAHAATAAVLLGDTMGELPTLLAAGDVAFMGGSLVEVGGHNPLEPAALGLPVITGPHIHNFAGTFALLREAGAARTATGEEELAAAVTHWLRDGTARQQAGSAGREVVAAHQGALERLIEALDRRARRPGRRSPYTGPSPPRAGG
ncbi:lipid IV(A) 3-deoxy-D-manno-octulosonic acid transferase [Arhodomonas sp. SL1]|uniref:lipid IV(A) 3-deoxy-D-manno-octulosonic acid transferase n=1 Tax=Arhodomonas sp. SL1 TaxID=3425691 RepID=UPI003F88391D